VAAIAGTNDTRHSACISLGDYNNDGWVDIYLVNNGSENRLYKNNGGNNNKWVILKLTGVISNRSAVGTRVRLKTGSLNQIREVQGGSGGKGQNSLPLEFGLGSASVIDSIIVRWPSGTIQGFANVSVSNTYSLTEGGVLVGVNQTGTEFPKDFLLGQNYPNPFNPGTVISFQLAVNSFTTIKIYDALGREIQTLVDEELQAGTYEVNFEGPNLPSGVYFYKLEAENFTDTKKMILVK